MAKENVETLEKGNIYFFYRPKIDVGENISGVDDIQNFYFVLGPKAEKNARLMIIGKESLPGFSKNEKSWGFVKRSSTKKQISEELGSFSYETKTRGKRENPVARPCGEGVYQIVSHGDHTHLIYALELPEEPDKVQKALKIREEGNYIVSVKNPEKGQPANAGLSKDQKADFPKKLHGLFEDKRFVPVDPPDFLNYDHAEIMFIGIDKDVKKELGIELNPEKETENKADIFKDLNIDKQEHPAGPLFEGEWT
ncbi:MAG: hypothetical protein WEB89_06795 [Balneolales bacterium]